VNRQNNEARYSWHMKMRGIRTHLKQDKILDIGMIMINISL